MDEIVAVAKTVWFGIRRPEFAMAAWCCSFATRANDDCTTSWRSCLGSHLPSQYDPTTLSQGLGLEDVVAGCATSSLRKPVGRVPIQSVCGSDRIRYQHRDVRATSSQKAKADMQPRCRERKVPGGSAASAGQHIGRFHPSHI